MIPVSSTAWKWRSGFAFKPAAAAGGGRSGAGLPSRRREGRRRNERRCWELPPSFGPYGWDPRHSPRCGAPPSSAGGRGAGPPPRGEGCPARHLPPRGQGCGQGRRARAGLGAQGRAYALHLDGRGEGSSCFAGLPAGAASGAGFRFVLLSLHLLLFFFSPIF